MSVHLETTMSVTSFQRCGLPQLTQLEQLQTGLVSQSLFPNETCDCNLNAALNSTTTPNTPGLCM